MAFYRLFELYIEFTALVAYIECFLLIVSTGIKPGWFWTKLLNLCSHVANSFVIIHPVYFPSFIRDSEQHHSMILHNLECDQEPIIEFIYSTYENYKVDEQWHIVADHLGKLHIGLVLEVINEYNETVSCIDILVRPDLFFHFPMESAKKYLVDFMEGGEVILASDLEYQLRIHGLYDLPDFPFIFGLKTYWISFIQRKWKHIYAEKKRLLMLRGSLKAQRQFELSGNYGIRSFVKLRRTDTQSGCDAVRVQTNSGEICS